MNSGVLPEFGDVGEHRHATGAGELAVFIEGRQRLSEDHVGAGRDILLRALQRCTLTLDGVRVGARHHDEVRVAARVHGGLDAVGHLVGGDERLAGPMTAALALHLVLEVHAARRPRV